MATSFSLSTIGLAMALRGGFGDLQVGCTRTPELSSDDLDGKHTAPLPLYSYLAPMQAPTLLSIFIHGLGSHHLMKWAAASRSLPSSPFLALLYIHQG